MFIVIEKHGGWEYATVISDHLGISRVFDTLEEAQKEADDCQDGIVVGDEIIEQKNVSFKQELEAIEDLLHVTDNTHERGEIFKIIEKLLKQIE